LIVFLNIEVSEFSSSSKSLDLLCNKINRKYQDFTFIIKKIYFSNSVDPYSKLKLAFLINFMVCLSVSTYSLSFQVI
jgi:hypothetical protein